jgi:predicted component of type VI protein secretion system
VHKVELDKLKDDQAYAKEIYDSGDWYNKKTLTKDRIQKVSADLKKTNKHQKITHIMDREFDDNDY